MNRYKVNVQKSIYSPIRTIFVEASSWVSAGNKAERANPIVTSVTRVACGCFHNCDCK